MRMAAVSGASALASIACWNAASTFTAGLASFVRPASFGQAVDERADVLDGGVGHFERLDDLFFRDLLRARFDHHDAVLAAGDGQVEAAQLALGEGRIDDVLAVDQADAHAGDGLLERHLRQRQRRRGAGDGEHVGVVVGVGRQHERDDLRLEGPARRGTADESGDRSAGS